MSQSNNSQEFDNILFQVNSDESQVSDSFTYQNNITVSPITDEISLASNDIMSTDDFLDLVPANSYFH